MTALPDRHRLRNLCRRGVVRVACLIGRDHARADSDSDDVAHRVHRADVRRTRRAERDRIARGPACCRHRAVAADDHTRRRTEGDALASLCDNDALSARATNHIRWIVVRVARVGDRPLIGSRRGGCKRRRYVNAHSRDGNGAGEYRAGHAGRIARAEQLERQRARWIVATGQSHCVTKRRTEGLIAQSDGRQRG